MINTKCNGAVQCNECILNNSLDSYALVEQMVAWVHMLNFVKLEANGNTEEHAYDK